MINKNFHNIKYYFSVFIFCKLKKYIYCNFICKKKKEIKLILGWSKLKKRFDKSIVVGVLQVNFLIG